MTGPAHDKGCPESTFPSFAFLSLERRDAAVREGDSFRAVVGGEDDNGIVKLTHGFEFLEHFADVVIHLLHAGFVDAPVLTPGLAYHGHVLVRQNGRDMHTSRIVPDKERLIRFLGIIAVEEVDHLRGYLLVHRLRTLERKWPLIAAHLILS